MFTFLQILCLLALLTWLSSLLFFVLAWKARFEDEEGKAKIFIVVSWILFLIGHTCYCVNMYPDLFNIPDDWRDQSYVSSGSSNSGGSGSSNGNGGGMGITHYDNCKCRECLGEKENSQENVHDKDCQCSTCKPHDEDCQCSKCVEKYCNSFNHGDDCECDKCLYCKEYVK